MKHYVFLFLLTITAAFAQQRKPLLGRVIAGDAVVPNVFVINKYTGVETKTSAYGDFTLPARAGDRIVIYGKIIEVREFEISEASFNQKPYLLEVDPKGTELKEVVINKISPESLGLVPKGQKQLTVAERRLKTASEFKPNFMFLLMGGIAFPLDPIINAISGRTKMLKKNLATERKEFNIDKLNNIYTPEQITAKLHIPEELVNGFIFYAVEDPECAEALRVKNNDMVRLRLMLLAEQFLALQKENPEPPADIQPSIHEN